MISQRADVNGVFFFSKEIFFIHVVHILVSVYCRLKKIFVTFLCFLVIARLNGILFLSKQFFHLAHLIWSFEFSWRFFLGFIFNFWEREREKRRKSVTKFSKILTWHDINSRSEGIIPSKTNRIQVQAPLLLRGIFYISFWSR